MAYAFENTPWHLVPESEQIAVAVMQAQIRDNYLTMQEHYAKIVATQEIEKSNKNDS